MTSSLHFPRSVRLLAPALLAGTLLLPSVSLAAQSATRSMSAALGHQAANQRWVTYDAANHTAHLTLISSYGQDTYNFNGGVAGRFTVKVPLNSKVVVTYSNMSAMMRHGAEVVTWTGTLPTQGTIPLPAFPGAVSPNYRHGTAAGITQTFSFTASTAGKYLIICPVRNHVKFGHWAWFIVSKNSTTATARLAK